MSKPVLPFVETMVTQSCNLSCEGCSNYSDLPHKGFVSWKKGRRSIERWLERVDIADFGILGGEPLMHPRIEDWIMGLREIMPTAQIRFTTNGLLLKKKFHVIKLLEDIGNCVFKIAVHRHDPELEAIIKKVQDAYDWRPVTEFGVNRFTTGDRFRFHVKRPDVFWKIYQGTYETMFPYDSEPSEAIEICGQGNCPLLYNDRIYKCSTNGLLRDTLERVGRPNWEKWQPYLNDGIGPECSDSELESFLNNFGKPHSVCRMCPSKKYANSRLIHIDHVSTKKYKLSNTNNH